MNNVYVLPYHLMQEPVLSKESCCGAGEMWSAVSIYLVFFPLIPWYQYPFLKKPKQVSSGLTIKQNKHVLRTPREAHRISSPSCHTFNSSFAILNFNFHHLLNFNVLLVKQWKGQWASLWGCVGPQLALIQSWNMAYLDKLHLGVCVKILRYTIYSNREVHGIMPNTFRRTS